LPEIVQDIGAYAGLASVVGLAVLSVLYFSQARDVRRLREWAGRAPERAEQGTVPVTPTPGKAVPQQQPPQPAAKAPAVPAATGARPAAAAGAAGPAQGKQAAANTPAAPAPAAAGATATAKPAAASAQSDAGSAPATPQPGSKEPAGAAAPTALKSGTPPRAQPGAGSGQGQPAAEQNAPAAPPVPGAPRPPAPAAGGGRQGGPPPAPSQARPQPSGRPAPQPTEILPPPAESWHQRIFGSTRNLILAVCAVVLLGGGVALALTQLSGEDSGTPSSPQPAQEPQGGGNGGNGGNGGGQGGGGQGRNRPAIDPASVTVAVLNGTTVPGLASRVSDEVQSAGFQVGTVANSADQDQQRAESVILFAPGHEREAAAVSRRLDIAQREPIDAATQGLAGDATVVVVTGADRS
jgi:hypothetical protein